MTKPPRVGSIEQYWDRPPPERSPRCAWWVEQIKGGWRENRRIKQLGYYEAAQFYGVYLWEYLHVITRLLSPLAEPSCACGEHPIEVRHPFAT